jgi:hypothetical protein
MELIFKNGDRVFDIEYGWGTVDEIQKWNNSSVHVIFDDNVKRTYMYGGLYSSEGGYPRKVLSFTEYKLEGFSQERPELLPNKGDIVWTRGEFPSEWEIGHFYGKQGKEYLTYISPSLQGWNNRGIEITTTNPYKDENTTPISN